MKGCRLKSVKGKGTGPDFQEQTGISFQMPLPAEAQGMCFILPGTMCDNTCELLPTREAYQRLCIPGFYGGSAT